MAFKDYFSGHASAYAESRPDYPVDLFAFLAGLCASHDHAWDCATGNGQAARALAAQFARVTATDASADQIANAPVIDGVVFEAASAEASGLGDASVDCVTVAQAAHWFDTGRFHAEVERVVRPGGVVARWCYGHCAIEPEIDQVVREFYAGPVNDHWPPERRHIESGYADLDFPFERVPTPAFAMRKRWDRRRYLAYIATWSAVKRYVAETGEDPIERLDRDLDRLWPAEEEREIVWPLALQVGRR